MNKNELIFDNFNLIEDSKKNSENYTFISIAEKIYAVKTKDVREIIKLVELDYPHQMPSYILGLINFEEKPTAVIDLREVFKNERITYSLNSKILILQYKKGNIAIICDNVCDIKKLM